MPLLRPERSVTGENGNKKPIHQQCPLEEFALSPASPSPDTKVGPGEMQTAKLPSRYWHAGTELPIQSALRCGNDKKKICTE